MKKLCCLIFCLVFTGCSLGYSVSIESTPEGVMYRCDHSNFWNTYTKAVCRTPEECNKICQDLEKKQ